MWDAIRALNLEDWGNLATVIAAIAGAVAAIAALSSVRATRQTVGEMERARTAQTRPLVLLTARREAGKIMLVIKNYGGPAADVRVYFPERVPWEGGEDLNDAPLFRWPLPVMSPGEELRLEFGFWPSYWFTYEADASGGRVKTGWSGRPEDFNFNLTYRDPFTDRPYHSQGAVSIRHLAPTAGDGGSMRSSRSDQ